MIRRLARFAPLALGLGCGNVPASTPVASAATAAPPVADDCTWTPAQKQLSWAVTSVYENDTTVLQYRYCENIHDGRGYTSGRAGFCSGTGDAIQVIDCFDAALVEKGLGARDRMAKYAKALRGMTGADTSPVDKVGPYCRDWAASATDSVTAGAFKRCQDQVVARLYQGPACRAARAWGITSPLFLAELYDAWINHGSGDELLDSAARKAGVRRAGAPLSHAEESALLQAFLTLRLDVLRKDSTWALAVDRVAPYEAARRAGNFDLGAPVDTGAKAATLWPGLGLVDSKAPFCKLTIVGDGANKTLSVTGEKVCTSQDVGSSMPGQVPVAK